VHARAHNSNSNSKLKFKVRSSCLVIVLTAAKAVDIDPAAGVCWRMSIAMLCGRIIQSDATEGFVMSNVLQDCLSCGQIPQPGGLVRRSCNVQTRQNDRTPSPSPSLRQYVVCASTLCNGSNWFAASKRQTKHVPRLLAATIIAASVATLTDRMAIFPSGTSSYEHALAVRSHIRMLPP
jgi:hypothetical protein